MSKRKSTKKNKEYDLMDHIEEYLVKSRNEILNLLANRYKYSEKDAFKIEDSIYTSTRSSMRDLYTFIQDFPTLEKFRKTNDIYESSITEYPDFVNWSWIALHVIYYQSLGDTMGYYNGNWEFNYGDITAGPDYVSELIYEFIHLGGVNDLSIKNWMSSDDTILYMATFEVLSKLSNSLNSLNSLNELSLKNISEFGKEIKKTYIREEPKIQNRDPGQITKNSLEIQQNIEWDKLPYNSRDIGAGSSMRSGCIGIFFPGKRNRKILISLSVESSRITHNSAIAILGSITSALFTSYSLEHVSINRWPHKLLKLLRSNIIDEYMKQTRPNEYPLYARDKIIYIGQWEKYVNLLFSGINPRLDLKFMKNPVQRYKYLSENFSKGCDIPGSCGDDALIMAYDALLRCDGVFEKLIVYAILHPGDSDTVGSIAFSWFGGYYHSPRNEMLVGRRFDDLEFSSRLEEFLKENIPNMVKVFYYDLYMNISRKYLKKYIGE